MVSALATLALLCPTCARDTRPGAFVLLGAMILLPFGVTAIVLRVIRRANQKDLEP